MTWRRIPPDTQKIRKKNKSHIKSGLTFEYFENNESYLYFTNWKNIYVSTCITFFFKISWRPFHKFQG